MKQDVDDRAGRGCPGCGCPAARVVERGRDGRARRWRCGHCGRDFGRAAEDAPGRVCPGCAGAAARVVERDREGRARRWSCACCGVVYARLVDGVATEDGVMFAALKRRAAQQREVERGEVAGGSGEVAGGSLLVAGQEKRGEVAGGSGEVAGGSLLVAGGEKRGEVVGGSGGAVGGSGGAGLRRVYVYVKGEGLACPACGRGPWYVKKTSGLRKGKNIRKRLHKCGGCGCVGWSAEALG